MRFGKGVFFLAPCLLTVILCISTFEALAGGHHPRDAKKVQVTGAGGRLRELRNTEFVLACERQTFLLAHRRRGTFR